MNLGIEEYRVEKCTSFTVLLGAVLGSTLTRLLSHVPISQPITVVRGLKYPHWTFLCHIFTLIAKVRRR